MFDVADLIKDAIILPRAFICAKDNTTEQKFRQQCLQAFTDHKALDFMFEQVKQASLTPSFVQHQRLMSFFMTHPRIVRLPVKRNQPKMRAHLLYF